MVCRSGGILKMKVKIATIVDKAEVLNIFKKQRKVFPHIRTDYIQRQIQSKNVVFDKKVIIINQQYKRDVSLGDKKFEKGTCIIHQIVNAKQGNGNAYKILNKFVKSLPQNADCILTVRKSNHTARRFYKKNGFKSVGNINWSNNSIEGLIYKLRRVA